MVAGGTVEPIDVQVITYAPTVFYHCQHCELTFQEMGVGGRVHREQAREALPDDLRDDFQRLSDWVHDLIDRHGERITFKVIDAASLEGFWKSIRYGVRRYPAVIVQRRDRYVGSDFDSLTSVIERELREAPGSSRGDQTVERGWATRSEPSDDRHAM